MTDQIEDTKVSETDELEILKSRARMMGVTFSNNIGIETLKARIEAKMAGEELPPEPGVNGFDAAAALSEKAPETAAAAQAEPEVETPMTIRQKLIKEQMKLVRVRITNLDPKKANLPGEIFTIANKFLGTVRKYVPYGEVTDDGWHLPNCIYQELDSRRFLHIRTTKDRRTGAPVVHTNWAKEFALEVLPTLTKEELARLANAQAAAGSIDAQ